MFLILIPIATRCWLSLKAVICVALQKFEEQWKEIGWFWWTWHYWQSFWICHSLAQIQVTFWSVNLCRWLYLSHSQLIQHIKGENPFILSNGNIVNKQCNSVKTIILFLRWMKRKLALAIFPCRWKENSHTTIIILCSNVAKIYWNNRRNHQTDIIMDKILVNPVFVMSTLKNKHQWQGWPFTEQKNNADSAVAAVTMTAWLRQMLRAALSVGTGCQTWSPWGVQQRGPEPTRPAVSRGAGAKACSLSGGSSTHAKLKMTFWLSYIYLHVLNCREEATLDFPPYLRMMKMFETFLVLSRFDKLLQRYLLTSAWCVGARQVSPAVLLSLNPCLSLSPIFPSLTCVISFFTPTSLPLFY